MINKLPGGGGAWGASLSWYPLETEKHHMQEARNHMKSNCGDHMQQCNVK